MVESQVWRKTGLAALLLIVISAPLAWYLHRDLHPAKLNSSQAFVGREACIDCHQNEYKLWQQSHHARAMAVASDSTVLGDFNNAEINSRGVTTRFYKKDKRFYVHTVGEDGDYKEYLISHTFGYTPLQQYLVPFPGGRYQCLPIAWDTEKKQWFDMAAMVYPDEDLHPANWLYWTNQSQNWNGMCAECHSTNLQKNYDPQKKTYNTTWSEINVSCESCHGPGSAHVEWARLPEMDRDYEGDMGLTLRTSLISSRQQVELCAPCHSRRGSLQNLDHRDRPLLDLIDPQLPVEPFYFIDGQIREEVYVYGSFTQSKMYLRDVRCSDCHNAHSGKLLFEGNKLCTQCHIPADYDTYDHHFHKQSGEQGQPILQKEQRIEVGEGAQCISCHMPARYYMGIDLRNDHSMRIPRPDLTMKLGTPNPCQDCHRDQTAAWSQKYIEQWYGKSRRSHYAGVFDGAAHNTLDDPAKLRPYLNEDLYPEMVRATAVHYMAGYPDSLSKTTMQNTLADAQAVVRLAAVRNYQTADAGELKKFLFPLLHDHVKSIRIQAANRLIGMPGVIFTNKQRELLNQVLAEYVAAQKYTADFATTQHNLGLYYHNINQPDISMRHYQEALRIDKDFFPARVNLAMLQYNSGQIDAAIQSFIYLRDNHTDFQQSWYYLGLLYAEKENYPEAALHLEKAVQITPQNTRIPYNLGLIYQRINQMQKAEKILLFGYKQSGGNYDYAFALADFYLKNGNSGAVEQFAKRMLQHRPDDTAALSILQAIKRKP